MPQMLGSAPLSEGGNSRALTGLIRALGRPAQRPQAHARAPGTARLAPKEEPAHPTATARRTGQAHPCRPHRRRQDAFCGPLLAQHAAAAGVIYSLAFGDQPALICDRVDCARTCGFPVVVVVAGRGHKWLPLFCKSTPDTLATAKRDLAVGEVLDGEGGYTVWGKLLPVATSLSLGGSGGLPLGLAHGPTIVRAVKKGQSLTWADVSMHTTTRAFTLRRERERLFAPCS